MYAGILAAHVLFERHKGHLASIIKYDASAQVAGFVSASILLKYLTLPTGMPAAAKLMGCVKNFI